MKDSAAENTGVEEGESHTQGQGEEHAHTQKLIQVECMFDVNVD